MPEERRLLVNVGMKHLPFPIRVASKLDPDGQFTIADISVSARIFDEFEARWIDKFIRTFHQHQGRDAIGTRTLKTNVVDYLDDLKATSVKLDFEYPFFIEKVTPVSKEKCLVRYQCTYSAKISSTLPTPKITFRIDVPAISTDPASVAEKEGGLFGQLSVVSVQVESEHDIYPEDLVAIIDKHALSPVYSFLAPEDKIEIIQRVHAEKKSSVVITDAIKEDLAHNPDISWYAVGCSNFGMLHSYSTVVGTEKSSWVPFSGYEDEDV